MSSRIGVITNAFQEEKLIEGCIKQFQGTGFKHVVLIPLESWNGGYELGPDQTGFIASNLGAYIFYGRWQSASDQLNFGLKELKDCDWVIICDADERYKKIDLINMVDYLETVQHDVVKTSDWEVYWKDSDHVLLPHQTDYPTIAVRPHVRFQNIRDTGLPFSFIPVTMYHFSYMRSDEEMLKKISTFDAAKQFQVQKWYNDIWLKWTPEMTHLHPVNPRQFERALWNPAPKEIKELLPI